MPTGNDTVVVEMERRNAANARRKELWIDLAEAAAKVARDPFGRDKPAHIENIRDCLNRIELMNEWASAPMAASSPTT